MLTVTQEGQTASEEGRSRSQVSIYKLGYCIPNPTPHSSHLFPFGSPIHAPIKIQNAHTASPCCLCLFYLQQQADFSRSVPQHQTPKRQQCFFQGLGFHNLQLGREKQHMGKSRAGVCGAGSIPPADPYCRDILSKGRNLGRWIWIAEPHDCWEKLTRGMCTYVWKHHFTNACIYIHVYISVISTGSLSDYGGK